MEDYKIEMKVKKNVEVADVTCLLKVWSCARVYEWGGIETIDQLPNDELRFVQFKWHNCIHV